MIKTGRVSPRINFIQFLRIPRFFPPLESGRVGFCRASNAPEVLSPSGYFFFLLFLSERDCYRDLLHCDTSLKMAESFQQFVTHGSAVKSEWLDTANLLNSCIFMQQLN